MGPPGSCSLCCMQLQHPAGTAPWRAAHNPQLMQRSVFISDRNDVIAELNDLLPSLITASGSISSVYDMSVQTDGNTTHTADDPTCTNWVSVLCQQIFLLLDTVAVDLHLQGAANEAQLQRALHHREGRMESVIAKVVTNALWHCFSCHQWADMYAVAYAAWQPMRCPTLHLPAGSMAWTMTCCKS